MKCTAPWYNRALNLLHACGKCWNCVQTKKREWVLRLCHEFASYRGKAVFVTLTYAPEHLPAHGSLCKRDYQLFLKRLRKHFKALPRKIKAFVVGEYGPHGTIRPHYHAILFGLDNHDLPFVPHPSRAKKYEGKYISHLLHDLWGLGWCQIRLADLNSFRYVATYSIKVLTAPKNQFNWHKRKSHDDKRILPFKQGPLGLGKDYALQHASQISRTNTVVGPNGKESTVPKYYRKVLNSYGIDWHHQEYADLYDAQESELNAFEEATGQTALWDDEHFIAYCRDLNWEAYHSLWNSKRLTWYSADSLRSTKWTIDEFVEIHRSVDNILAEFQQTVNFPVTNSYFPGYYINPDFYTWRQKRNEAIERENHRALKEQWERSQL